jgi:hypothetical protein
LGVYSRIVEATFGPEPAAGPERPEPGPADLEQVVDDVGGRIEEIVDAAERVGALADSLGFRLESLQREAQALVDVLDRAKRSLGELAEAAAAPQAREEPPPAPAAEPRTRPALAPSRPSPQPAPAPPHPVPEARPAASPPRVPEQAVLRATQMAVAGTGRAEIEQMLREEFGVTEPAGVVDRMLRSDR